MRVGDRLDAAGERAGCRTTRTHHRPAQPDRPAQAAPTPAPAPAPATPATQAVPAPPQPAPSQAPADPGSPGAQPADAAAGDEAADRTPPQQSPAADPVDAEFSRLDRDGDGRVTAAEHAADAKARFDAMDADHNYHLSAAELHAAVRDGDTSVAAQIADDGTIGSMDANANGEVSVDEQANAAESDFRAMDANGDGAVDRDEMTQASPQPEGPPSQ